MTKQQRIMESLLRAYELCGGDPEDIQVPAPPQSNDPDLKWLMEVNREEN